MIGYIRYFINGNGPVEFLSSMTLSCPACRAGTRW